MKISQVAAQTYTVRDHLTGLSAFSKSLERIAAIGYRAVELIPSETVKDQEAAKVCADAGLTIAAVHVPGSVLLAHPEAIEEKLTTLGATIAVYAYPHGVNLSKRLEVEQLASRLEQSAQVMERAGFRLAYHNHALEFARCDGERVLDHLLRTAPTLAFELDTYWVQFGGGSPERWIQALHGKLATVHLKDYGFDLHKNAPFMTEIGNGNLDFDTIIAEAEKAGSQWFIVEQDETPGDPFTSLERSFRYLRDRVAQG